MSGGKKSWHQIKKKEKKIEKSSEKHKACALFHDDIPQVMYTNQKNMWVSLLGKRIL